MTIITDSPPSQPIPHILSIALPREGGRSPSPRRGADPISMSFSMMALISIFLAPFTSRSHVIPHCGQQKVFPPNLDRTCPQCPHVTVVYSSVMTTTFVTFMCGGIAARLMDDAFNAFAIDMWNASGECTCWVRWVKRQCSKLFPRGGATVSISCEAILALMRDVHDEHKHFPKIARRL